MSYFGKKALLCALCCSFVLPSMSIFAESLDIVDDPVVVEDTVEEVVEQVVNEELQIAIPGQKLKSLIKRRPEIFSLGTFLSIDTVGDPSKTHIRMINKPLGHITTFQLAKDKLAQERGKWDDVKVLRQTKYVYTANLEFDRKYEGCRETLISKALEKMFGLTKHFTGTILLDEYRNFPLWNVSLKDVVELRSFLTYLEDCLAERGHRAFDEKPVLRLILEEDVLLRTLDVEDEARLHMLFDVVNPRDFKAVKFFDEVQFDMDGVIRHLATSHPFEPKKGLRRGIIDTLESTFTKFEGVEFFPKLIIGTGVLIGSGIVLHFSNKITGYTLGTKYLRGVSERIFGKAPPSPEVTLLQQNGVTLNNNGTILSQIVTLLTKIYELEKEESVENKEKVA